MSIPCAVLMCHAPIVIPQIGGARAAECARTTFAMREVASRLVAHQPDVMVIISPHAPRDPRRFGVVHDAWLHGDFAQFGAPDVGVRVRGAPAAADTLCELATARGVGTWRPSGSHLDHGAMVPLWFVVEAGYMGPVLLIALPYPDGGREADLGHAIAETARAHGQRFAVLASGDMSHRLRPNAPAGYHPRARHFDAHFVELIGQGNLDQAAAIDPELRELAAEDVVDSCTVAAGAVGFDTAGHRVVAYEGPFGVGYLEAVLHEPHPPSPRTIDGRPPQSTELLAIAREAIRSHLRAEPFVAPRLAPPFEQSRGVFVTLRNTDGSLRGCIGHMEPVFPTLAEEIASCAVSAAVRDSRFAPVQTTELDGLRLELSLLSPSEPIDGLDDLDPSRYGVVVEGRGRRGVLLPDLEGVDTAAQQVRIAASKAGLHPDEDLSLRRFEVEKMCEATEADAGPAVET